MAGAQDVFWWQFSQDVSDKIWVFDLPVASVPLWQVKHAAFGGDISLCWNVAGSQAVVVWQVAQAFDVGA